MSPRHQMTEKQLKTTPIFAKVSIEKQNAEKEAMQFACCTICDGQSTNRHSRCQSGPWNERLRYPNYISGYTGKIPINLRWDGGCNPWETRDFHSRCKEPVNTLYVVHPSQYLSDGTREYPKVRSCQPCPFVRELAYHANHPRGVICSHEHPLQRLPLAYERMSERASGGARICCTPCACEPAFMDYRLRPPDQMKCGLKHGRTI